MSSEILILDEVDSTSEEAKRHAPPVWVMARRQTAARGRRGRAWSMPPGNFAASHAFRPPGGPADWALRSFSAALALHDALADLAVAGLSLKWPNDVLRDGGKLAGILLESPGDGVLVIGWGVNLAAAPDAVEAGGTLPAALDGTIAPETLLDALVPAFAAREAELAEGGFAPIRAAWLARAARIGQPVVARTMRDTLHGTFDDIDASGHLILKTPAGPVPIAAADLYFEGA
ncbi:biotin--[acetyl-CoA-carboxylase] ligase [Jannaschia sp. Os4]|uniref:biotin--[acetyl-CoA-carboxylase] ligase n=1 Tax=Jannaschia sp. Os4 TaxID=2807617 RepID=UPI001939B713|nr:biotin--[acetyl-CoA-carboxylase] ligase [Jannaschia sp. Os4]MBM2576209.1 biotin--[acetyl-CoA-carboxylase] ligase [Jannaschia sp. Os4]